VARVSAAAPTRGRWMSGGGQRGTEFVVGIFRGIQDRVGLFFAAEPHGKYRSGDYARTSAYSSASPAKGCTCGCVGTVWSSSSHRSAYASGRFVRTLPGGARPAPLGTPPHVVTGPTDDVRETILTVIGEHAPRSPTDGSLQQGTILIDVARRLGIHNSTEREVAVLVAWNDLFRTGYLGWGLNLNNPDPPFFHVTDRGRRALERLSRDPGNPAGYRRHLATLGRLTPVAASYVGEGLSCYANGLHKAAAVMLGAAAESIVLDIRDTVVFKGIGVPSGLSDRRVSKVLEALRGYLGSKAQQMPQPLRETFESYWPAFTQQIRVTRNEAGHPTSVEPVSEDAVHASFLVFPELVRVSTQLNDWIATHLS
jgi:hypothetical protein